MDLLRGHDVDRNPPDSAFTRPTVARTADLGLLPFGSEIGLGKFFVELAVTASLGGTSTPRRSR